MKSIIVTGANETFYPLVQSLIQSLHRLKLEQRFDIGILDAGFNQQQQSQLRDQAHHLIPLQFDSNEQSRRFRQRRHLLVNYAKPRLNQLFSQYEIIIFLDADTWVQTDTAFDYLVDVAQQDKLAIVSQASRLQNSHLNLKFHPFTAWWHRVEPKGILYKNARRAQLSRALQRSLVARPVLNCGVYALKSTAPHWQAWQHWQVKCLKNGRVFTSDQLSLALAVDQNQLAYEALPEICNYLNPPIWRFDTQQHYFTELYIPYTPISIMHLAGVDDKLNSQLTVPCIDEHGHHHQRSLYYQVWQEGQKSNQ